MERGDADISYELPYKDFQELKAAGKLDIVSLPFSNGIQSIGMNVTKPPFDNLKVRQAVAFAIPYQKIMDAVLFGLANPMFGAPASKTTEVAWPQPTKYFTDIAKAKALLTEAGSPDGFETTISFDLNFAGSMSRSASWYRRAWARSASRPPSARCPAPTGAPN